MELDEWNGQVNFGICLNIARQKARRSFQVEVDISGVTEREVVQLDSYAWNHRRPLESGTPHLDAELYMSGGGRGA